MNIIQAIILGGLQGATEFLPISSSAHLVLFPYLLGWEKPGLALDTALHLGTLIAVLVYFRQDLLALIRAAWESVQRRSLADPQARLVWMIALATVPAALGGFVLENFFESLFGMPRWVAFFLLITAGLLALAEGLGKKQGTLEALTWRDALLIGLAQLLAVTPGISRSGATIAAALLLGYRRDEAARFSFLIAIPIILGSGAYQILKLVLGTGTDALGLALAGVVTAALVGYLAIAGLMRFLRQRTLWPFALYCVLVSLAFLSGVLG